MTISEALDRWFQVRQTRWTSPAHAAGVRGLVEAWKGEWGGRLLTEVSSLDVESRLLARTVLGRSDSRLNQERVQLQCFFRWAIRHGLVTRDPTEVWERRRVRTTKKPVEITPELEAALLTGAGDRAGWVQFSLYSGLRAGTTRKLRWRMVVDDPDGAAWLRIPGELMKGRRDFYEPLAPQARAALGERGRAADLVFPYLPSPSALSQWFRRLWESVCGQGERPTPHDLRKSFASRLLDRGAAITTVCELGDWTSEAVLMRHYKARVRASAARDTLRLLEPEVGRTQRLPATTAQKSLV